MCGGSGPQAVEPPRGCLFLLLVGYTANVRRLANRLRRPYGVLALAMGAAIGALGFAGCVVSLQGTCATCDPLEDDGAFDGSVSVDAQGAMTANEAGIAVDAGGDASSGAKGAGVSIDAGDASRGLGAPDASNVAPGCSAGGACAEGGIEDDCGLDACCDAEGGCASAEGSMDSGSDAIGCAVASDCPIGQACNTTTSECQPSCNDGALCNGCCDGVGNCQPGNDPNSCGNDGGLCATCTQGGTCMPGGYCSCRAATDCPPGLACRQGTGECQASCNGALCNGCCDQGFGAGACQAGTSPTQCNTGGHTCEMCACPRPACVPVPANGGGGGTCGCAATADCKTSCAAMVPNRNECLNDMCQ